MSRGGMRLGKCAASLAYLEAELCNDSGALGVKTDHGRPTAGGRKRRTIGRLWMTTAVAAADKDQVLDLKNQSSFRLIISMSLPLHSPTSSQIALRPTLLIVVSSLQSGAS